MGYEEMGVRGLIRKFRRVCREEGLAAAVGRAAHFAGNVEGRRERRRDVRYARRHKGEVLFINGYYSENPVRYRVLHQMEQLRLAGVSCAKVYFEDLEPGMADRYRMFIFYRCECTEEVKAFLRRARSQKKRIYFDVDDLVIDTVYTDRIPFVQAYPPETKEVFDTCVRRLQATLKLCDGAITTTEALAEELKKYVPKVYINRNTASEEMTALSEKAWQQYAGEKAGSHKRSGGSVCLGYFSGSATHDQDLEMISPALEKILREYPQASLLLAGELTIPEKLEPFGSRIHRHSAIGWQRLPELIVQTDINLAPLEDTLFNRAKSELKWFEAALVRVPTVASRVGAFAVMIRDGETGILCENTEEGWYRGMKELVESEQRRAEFGKRAYEFVMKACTTRSTASTYKNLIMELI